MLLQVSVSMEGACVRRDVMGGNVTAPHSRRGRVPSTQFTISWLGDLS